MFNRLIVHRRFFISLDSLVCVGYNKVLTCGEWFSPVLLFKDWD